MIVPLLLLHEASKLIGLPVREVVKDSVKQAVSVAATIVIVRDEDAVALLASNTVSTTV